MPGALGARGRGQAARRRDRHRLRRRVRQVGVELLRLRAPRRHRAAPAPGRSTPTSRASTTRRRTGRASPSSTPSTSPPSRSSRARAATGRASEKVTYTGGEAIQRDIANLKAAMEAAGVEEGFLPVVAPASCFPNLIDEHYGSEADALMGIAEALREEYKAIVDAGLYVQIDDAYIPFMYDVIVPPGHDGRLPRVGAAAHRRGQPRARGHPGRPRPLPRLLGHLERPAHQRHRAARRARPGLPGQRRHLPLRARQPAPRARVARVGGRRGARRASCSRRA